MPYTFPTSPAVDDVTTDGAWSAIGRACILYDSGSNSQITADAELI